LAFGLCQNEWRCAHGTATVALLIIDLHRGRTMSGVTASRNFCIIGGSFALLEVASHRSCRAAVGLAS